MKRVFALFSVLAALVAFSAVASAQSVDIEFLAGDGVTTNNVAVNTTNTVNWVIPAERVANVGVSISFELDAAGTDDINFHFSPSLYNATTYPTVGAKIVTLAGNGTTTVNFSTNWNIGAQPYLVLSKIGNTAGSGAAVTNVVIKYSTLRGQ